MMHNSSHAPNVPIIGQPIKVLGYTVIVSVDCTCSPGYPFQAHIVVGEGRYELVNCACPRCHTVYSAKPQSIDGNGLITFAVNVNRPKES